MANSDKLSIANRALLSVGARTYISSLDPSDGSAEANAVSTLWTPTFEQLGRAAPWNCLNRQITMSLLQAAKGTPENEDGTVLPLPPTPWLYAYSYPSNCLEARYIVPSYPANTGTDVPPTTNSIAGMTWLPSGGQIPFSVSLVLDDNNGPLPIILTNQTQAQLVYTMNQPNPAGWDSLFQEAMVAALGAFLVPALSLSLPLMDRCVKQAETAIAMARVRDGNEGVTSMDHLPDWMQARYGGQGMGWWAGQNGMWPGYYNVIWPSSGFGGGTYG